METYKGLIFDFNGVLWWDTELQERAWKEFSKAVRGREFSAEEMAIHVHGRNNKYTLEYLLGRTLAPDELAEYTQQKESTYRALCAAQGEKFKLSPGAVELLDFLVAHTIPHTIATASEMTNLRFFDQHLRLARWFDMSAVVYDDGTMKGKPAPDIYLRAATRLGLDPSACVVIEDARSGIASAHAAGIGRIIALGPKERHTELLKLPGVMQAIVDFTEVDRALFRV